MTRNVRRTTVAFLALFLFSLTSALVAGPSSAATQRGGLNLAGYCESKGYTGLKLIDSTAYGWRCTTSSTTDSIHVIDACTWQYGPGQIDRMSDYFDPKSWTCWTASKQLGGVNLVGYCKSKGYNNAALVDSTAYGWRCLSVKKTDSINMTDACKWQYKTTTAIDRMEKYTDPNSWKCWN
ncbi:hypothetical protein [Catenuloplanes japonicus]|uniref:hypothetical protein n=1 Tax=Catenuloplanes japonicus TaxID=33876 RepID=UPI0005244A36|nr:hypothetical protein [Catenuloplanes japonicus]